MSIFGLWFNRRKQLRNVMDNLFSCCILSWNVAGLNSDEIEFLPMIAFTKNGFDILLIQELTNSR